MERQHALGSISLLDLERVHAGALIGFYAYYEQSLEKLFLGILLRRLSRADVNPLVQIASDRVARDVIEAGRPYASWLPYDYTQRRAAAYFSGGRPFSVLTASDKQTLKRLAILRNAVAHESGSARSKFENEFVVGKSLPPGQHRPAGYLRGNHAAGQSRLAYHFAEAVVIFTKICQ